jgi:hypothetical protein
MARLAQLARRNADRLLAAAVLATLALCSNFLKI